MEASEAHEYFSDDGWISPDDDRYCEYLEHEFCFDVHAKPGSEWFDRLPGLWGAPFAERRRFTEEVVSAVIPEVSVELPCFFRRVIISDTPYERDCPKVSLTLQAATISARVLPGLLGRLIPVETASLRAAERVARPAVDILIEHPVSQDGAMSLGAAACYVSDHYLERFGGLVTIREDSRGLAVRVASSPPHEPWTGETLEKFVRMWATIATRLRLKRVRVRIQRLFVAEGEFVGQEIHEVW